MPDSEAIRQHKAALRKEALARRAALDAAWRERASAAIHAGILALPELARPRSTVSVFAGVGDEIDTRPLLERIIALHGSVLLPRVVRGERRLAFHRVTTLERGFVPAYQNIPEPDPAAWPETVEPAAMDLIVVPGLIFDRNGYRVGYGGGFYDRVLALPRTCRAVGIVFSPLLSEQALPTVPHDRRVDAIQTDMGFLAI